MLKGKQGKKLSVVFHFQTLRYYCDCTTTCFQNSPVCCHSRSITICFLLLFFFKSVTEWTLVASAQESLKVSCIWLKCTLLSHTVLSLGVPEVHNTSVDNISAATTGQWWLHFKRHPFPTTVRVTPVPSLAVLCSSFLGWGSSTSVTSDLISVFWFVKLLKAFVTSA